MCEYMNVYIMLSLNWKADFYRIKRRDDQEIREGESKAQSQLCPVY